MALRFFFFFFLPTGVIPEFLAFGLTHRLICEYGKRVGSMNECAAIPSWSRKESMEMTDLKTYLGPSNMGLISVTLFCLCRLTCAMAFRFTLSRLTAFFFPDARAHMT